MGLLQRFENRLEAVVSGAFAKAFRSAVQPVELAAALQREVDNKAQVVSRDRRLVPNSFDIELSAMDYERLAPYSATLSQELIALLREHADEQHYVFAGDVVIEFHQDDDLSTGRFRVKGAATATVTPKPSEGFFQRRHTNKDTNKDTNSAANDSSSRPGPARTPDAVVLEVNGTRQAVHPPGIVLGRGPESDLRINDPGVSRKHAEIRISGPEQAGQEQTAVTVVDLGSTNGTFVNGHRVDRAAVSDGGTVRVGNTEIVVRITAGGTYV
ncbi:MAG: DUF3662 domain-containing protein [Nocardioidaceae bacterium]|nr:MAG: DUF3662 domain-containing protein [Nocardioidaceae bacterium]